MKPRTPEHCKHLSESLKGRVISPEHRLKLSMATKGRPFTKEHREHQLVASFTPEAIAKRAESVKALWEDSEYREKQLRTLEQSLNTPEVQLKRSQSLKEYYSHPENCQHMSEICKQVPHNDEWNRKVSEAVSGENNHGWLGGISFLPYSLTFTKNLKESIKTRDGNKCRICGSEDKLCVHHIDYDKLNTDTINLISLCHTCHNKTNFNRNCWKEYLAYKNQQIGDSECQF